MTANSDPVSRPVWGRRLLAGAVAVFGLVCLLMVAVLAGLASDAGRRIVLDIALDAISQPGELEIRVGGTAGWWPWRLVLEEIEIADRDGVYAEIAKVDVQIDPGSLLSARVSVTSARVDGAVLHRAPAASEPPEPAPARSFRLPGIPTLPVAIDIAALAVDSVSLGPAVIGEAARFSLEGAGRLTASAFAATLDLQQTDRDGLDVTVVLEHEPATDRLRLLLDGRDPVGGIVSKLLDAPDLGAIGIGLDGTGTGAAWVATGWIDAGRLGDATLAVDGGWGDDRVLTFSMEGRPGAALPPDAVELIGPTPTIDGKFDPRRGLDQAPGLSLFDVDLTLAALSLQGQIGLSHEPGNDDRLAGGVTVALGDILSLVGEDAPVSVEGGQIDLTLAGRPSAPSIGLLLDAEGVTLGDAHAGLLLAGFDILPTDGLLHLDGEAALAGVDPGMADWPLGTDLGLTVDLVIDPEAESVRVETATLRADRATVEARGTASLAGTAADLDVTLVLEAVERIMPDLVEIGSLRSAIDLRLDGNILTAQTQSRLAVNTPADPVVAVLAGEGVRLSADGKVDLDTQHLTLSDVQMETASGRITLTGKGRFEPDTEKGEADIAVRVTDLEALGAATDMPLQGSVDLTASVAGTRDYPTANATLQAPRFVLRDMVLEDLTLSGEIEPSIRGIEGLVGVAFTEHRTEEVIPHRLSLSGVRRHDGATLMETAEGELVGFVPAVARSGTALSLSTKSLARLGTLLRAALGPDAPVPAAGSLTALIGVAPTPELDVQGAKLALAIPGGEPVTLASLNASARYEENDAEPQIRATVLARDLEQRPQRLESLSLEVDGALASPRFKLSLAEPGSSGLRLDATAALQTAGADSALTLVAFEASRAEAAARLAAPVTLDISSDGLVVPEIVLALSRREQTGRASFQARKTADGLDADIVLTEVPAGVIGLVPGVVPVSGQLDGTVSLASTPATGTGTVRLTATDLVVAPPQQVGRKRRRREAEGPTGRLSLDADWNGRTMDTRLRFGAGEDQTVDLAVLLPLGLSPEGLPDLPPDGAIEGTLAARGALGGLMPFLPVEEHRVTGIASADLALAGTVSLPTIAGTLSVRQGTYENLLSGTILDDMTLDFDTGAGDLTFTATDPDDGRLDARGTLKAGVGGLESEIDVSLTKLRLVGTDDLLVVASGDLAVVGSLADGFRVEGGVILDDVDVSVADKVPPSVVDLEVIEIHGEETLLTRPAEEADTGPPVPVVLKIDVAAKDTITVTGRGLDTRWGGDLAVTGDASDDPRVAGDIRLRRGRLEFLGRNFEIVEGLIAFDGGAEIDPRLVIEARNETPEVTAIVRITGPASKPEITLSSEPPLPPDAILAQVLFGKAPSELTTIELLQVGEAVSSLSNGGSGGFDPIGAAQAALGIDVFKVGLEEGENGERGVSVTVGKYVTDDIYVGVKQGSLPGTSAVTVELEVTRNLSVFTDVSQNAASVVGLRWKWDY